MLLHRTQDQVSPHTCSPPLQCLWHHHQKLRGCCIRKLTWSTLKAWIQSPALLASGTKLSKVVYLCHCLINIFWFLQLSMVLILQHRFKWHLKVISDICIFTTVQRRDGYLTKEQESRLPAHWLKSKGAHTTMADALWRLRDLMLRDSLNICQAYNL